MDEPLLGEDAEDLLHVVPLDVADVTSSGGRKGPAERLRGAERQLERSALDVIDEDVQVVRIDQRALRRSVEEVRRVADDELIERRAAGDEYRRRPAAAPSGAARPLPRRGNRTRVAGEH